MTVRIPAKDCLVPHLGNFQCGHQHCAKVADWNHLLFLLDKGVRRRTLDSTTSVGKVFLENDLMVHILELE